MTIVGMGASHNVELPLFNALSREVDIRGVFRYANEWIIQNILLFCYKYKYFYFYFSYQDALSLIDSCQVDLKPLITHHFKIEESLEAFCTAETGKGDPIKVMIHCNREL